MKIAYYLNDERKKNLYCRLNDGKERITFSLEYAVDRKQWDEAKNEVIWENEYHFALLRFKKYLTERYDQLKAENKDKILARLKVEAHSFIKVDGIEGIARQVFDHFHKDTGIPGYDQFITAFEKHSGLKKGQYKAEIIDSGLHFHTEDEVYEMDTYEGRVYELRRMIDNRWYDELALETNLNVWSEIFQDPGIKKHVIMPVLLNEWEIYWSDKYQEIRETIGKTDHLDSLKEDSWRKFQVFMSCYDSTPDGIQLGYNLDDLEFYPLVILSMMRIYEPATCYNEYCEHEFFSYGNWESVSLYDDEEDSEGPDQEDHMFFIRPYEI